MENVNETENSFSASINATPELSRRVGFAGCPGRKRRSRTVSLSSFSKADQCRLGLSDDAGVFRTCQSLDETSGTVETVHPSELQKFIAWTLITCRKIRNYPTLTVEAQVYRLQDAGEDRSWKELTSDNVLVHLYVDVVRGSNRVLCVDGSKPVINYTLTPNSIISRNATTPRFVQFGDRNAVNGLGFGSEIDANSFVNKLKELKGGLKGNQAGPPVAAVPPTAGDVVSYLSPGQVLGFQETAGAVTEPHHEYYRTEVERLTSALTESSVVAKHWGDGFQKLMKQNEELKMALEKAIAVNQGGGNGGSHAQAVPMPQIQADGGLAMAALPRSYDDAAYKRITPDVLSVSSAVNDQLKGLVEENKAMQGHWPMHESSQTQQQQDKRQLVLLVLKAIEDKLKEILEMNKALAHLI